MSSGAGSGARERLRSETGVFGALTPAVLFGAAAVGYAVTWRYAQTRAAIEEIYADERAVAEMDVWIATLGLVGGVALAIFVVSIMKLRRLIASSDAVTRERVLTWFVVAGAVLAALLGSIISTASSVEGPNSTNGQVGEATRWITYGVAVCGVPGLMYFLGIRRAATSRSGGREGAQAVLELRRDLIGHTAMFSVLLTLIVVATGLRRVALLAHDDTLNIPLEQVLLYGLSFAALLWLFHLTADQAIDQQTRALVDEYAPIPDPADDDIAGALADRDRVTGWLRGKKQTFETAVAIGSPLVTALIGAALGG